MQQETKWLQMFAPTWVVNVIGITLAVLVTAGTIVLSRFQSSELRTQVFGVQDAGADSSTYQAITDNIANNQLLSAAPLLIVWACVGLVVYFFAIAIARSFGQAVAMRDEMQFVHVSREQMLRDAFMQLGIRALAVIGFFIFLRLAMAVFVPYALSSAHIAAESLSLGSAAYAVLSASIIYVIVYVVAVFMRLIALRPRVFKR